MPAAQYSTMKVDALRKKAMALVQADTISAQQKASNMKAIKSMTKADLVAALVSFQQAEAKKKAAAQQKSRKASSKRQSASSTKRTTRKSRTRKTSGGARRAVKIPKPLRARAMKIVRAIKAGEVAVKQQKASPSAFPLQDARDRYTAFVKLYEDVRITRKSRKGRKKTRKSIKQVYAQVQGQKFPYMIKKARRIPARVGVIPGTGATPFNQLEEAEKRQVVAFLNTDKAKKLRQKGAPREVSFQKLTQKGAANR